MSRLVRRDTAGSRMSRWVAG